MKQETVWDVLEFLEMIQKDPSKLEDPNIPPELVKIVRPLLQKEQAKNYTIEDLQTEIISLYTELNNFSPGLDETDRDTHTQYLKLKTTLIGKIVELKERTLNLKSMKNFQDKLLFAIDKVLNAEQRTEFMKLLENA